LKALQHNFIYISGFVALVLLQQNKQIPMNEE